MKKSLFLLSALLFAMPSHAALVNIDLSGASTSTLINATGASFSQTFTGQSVSGIGITGTPTGPLSLTASGSLTVASFDPGCTGCNLGNSIIPQPSNTAPLAILLDSNADSFSWVMGSAVAGSSITIDLFSGDGSLVNSFLQATINNYNKYSISGLGTFAGLTFRNNNDPAGLRFMDMSYNSVSVNEVPLPAAAFLFAPALIGFMGLRRKAKNTVA
tara:strand:- start:3610 stop:4257 length:648 start_codon:yes stop_codon:yes gene_type:complete